MKLPTTLTQCTYSSPLGEMRLAASPQGLVGVWFTNQAHLPDSSQWPEQSDHPLLTQAIQQLREYFAAERLTFDLALDMQYGSDFQQTVWRTLLTIPRGSTTSYGALSQQMGHPKAVRAVGGAVGRNPLGIIVPCHRVIGADGSLTGYAGGLERKTVLLRLEGVKIA